jgi:cell division protein FtsB
MTQPSKHVLSALFDSDVSDDDDMPLKQKTPEKPMVMVKPNAVILSDDENDNVPRKPIEIVETPSHDDRKKQPSKPKPVKRSLDNTPHDSQDESQDDKKKKPRRKKTDETTQDALDALARLSDFIKNSHNKSSVDDVASLKAAHKAEVAALKARNNTLAAQLNGLKTAFAKFCDPNPNEASPEKKKPQSRKRRSAASTASAAADSDDIHDSNEDAPFDPREPQPLAPLTEQELLSLKRPLTPSYVPSD